MSITATKETILTTGRRLRVSTSVDFETVRDSLRNAMGKTTVPEIVALAQSVGDREEYARLVTERFAGPSGFMVFAEIDHGGWLCVYGILRRAERWIVGNPLIAITMLREDVTAGLFAPVEFLITECTDRAGCTVDYVLPSSVMVSESASPQLRDAAVALDRKFEGLIGQATGLSAALAADEL